MLATGCLTQMFPLLHICMVLLTGLWFIFALPFIQAPSGERVVLAAQTEAARKTALEKAAQEFFSLIEKGNPKQLVTYCSTQGVVFGVDAPPVKLAVIGE